jgi:hypothetical protein
MLALRVLVLIFRPDRPGRRVMGSHLARGRHDMQVMLLIKGDPQPGAAPSEGLLTAMGRYNDELKGACVLVGGAPLEWN